MNMADRKALVKGTNHGGDQDEVFRTVGKHVEAMKLDVAEPDEEEEPEDEELKVVDEIESLCMNCQGNVRHLPARFVHRKLRILTSCHGIGHYTTSAHESAVFPRDNLDVVRMPSLPFPEYRGAICRRDRGARCEECVGHARS